MPPERKRHLEAVPDPEPEPTKEEIRSRRVVDFDYLRKLGSVTGNPFYNHDDEPPDQAA